MITYPKIDSIYKRDDRGKFIIGEYSNPEFEYLRDNTWEMTEKVDGTNIRIGWDGEKVEIGGRTDNAQFHPALLEYLQGHFTPERFGDNPILLFGEGYGPKIQKNGHRYRDTPAFILFDAKAGDWWLKSEAITELAEELDIPRVPILDHSDLDGACLWSQKGFKSRIGDLEAEGIVLRPVVQILNRRGTPIITKVKVKDYR